MTPRFERRSGGPPRDGRQGGRGERRRSVPGSGPRDRRDWARDGERRGERGERGERAEQGRGGRPGASRFGERPQRRFSDNQDRLDNRRGRDLQRRELSSEDRPWAAERRRPDGRRRSGDERRQPPIRSRHGSSPVAAVRSRREEIPDAAAASPPPDDLVWGRHASQAALESGRPIHRIWCTAEMRSSAKFLQLLREAKASGVLVEEVTWARLGQITSGSVHQGIALQTAAAETLDLDGLINGCSDLGEPPLLLALDGVTDPHNLGAVVRSAEAMGAHGLVLPQRRSAGLTGSVAKVAAGALEHLPVARVVNLNRSLEKLKDAGYRVIGLAAEGDVTLTDVDLEGPIVLVTGSEDQGLSLLTRRHCDQLVRIPLRGVTPSLNASVATALCVYEVARRSWMKDIHGQAPPPPVVRPRTAPERESSQAGTAAPEERIDLSLSAPTEEADLHFDQSIQLSP